MRSPRHPSQEHRRKKKPRGAGRRIGLARAISKLGFCSRSKAAKLIRTGRVTLNGAVRRDPECPVQLSRDRLEVDGAAVRPAAKIYLMLNKPRGLVTTADDEKGRATVYACLPASLAGERRWLAPVGRLDRASEGLLLLTNDSEWAARIAAPETHLDKTYHVQIASVADDTLLAALTKGLQSGDDWLRVKRAAILRQGQRHSWLEIVLDEGKNRQIRRIFDALGIEVLRLVRVAIGPLPLGNLAKGSVRVLCAEEKNLLDRGMRPAHP